MQIQRLHLLTEGLSTQFTSQPSVINTTVFYKSRDEWHFTSGKVVANLNITQSLSIALDSTRHHRKRNSKFSWFPLCELQAVVRVETSSPIKSATRDTLQEAIQQCWKHAKDAYDASHDGLTGATNSKTLETYIIDALNPPANSTDDFSDSVQPQTLQTSTALLSFDIDHFKQINDSHGHDYGDIVLIIFANRIQESISALIEKHPTINLRFGRVGGEEFSVVATGKITAELISEIANELRNTIGETPLPTENEWNELHQESGNSSILLPHISDRKVTTSVGLSSIVTPTRQTTSRKLAEQIRHEADAALYRAKAGGRNVVRNFPSIRERYGSIIEHHPDTGIVAIDIGKDVDVQVGHEFSVFHPDFTGEKNFIRSDGRSKKTLGLYPRISCGRVVVFNAQRDIAFCFTEEKRCLETFPAGSMIQFIPAGSIKHLISAGAEGNVAISSRMSQPQDFEDSIRRLAANDADFSIVTITLLNASELENSHGVSTTNKALADLFRIIDAALPASSKISQISAFDISFSVCDWESEELFSEVESILNNAESRSMGLGRFGAGLYCSNEPAIGYLDKQHGLDYSRFAASPLLRSEASKCDFFTETTGEEILQAHREARSQTDGQQDYSRLLRLGLNHSSNFHNQGALCCFEGGPQNLEDANAAIERALEIEWDENYEANKAIILYGLDDLIGAESSFTEIENRTPDYVLPEVYKSARCMSAYHCYKRGERKGTPAKLLAMLEEAQNAPLLSTLPITKEQIKFAIADIALEI